MMCSCASPWQVGSAVGHVEGQSFPPAACHIICFSDVWDTGARGSPITAKQQVQVVVAACAGLQSGGVWLGEDERDVLTSWAALVFMAAEEVGCPAGSRLQQQAGADDSDSSSQSIASPAAGGPRGGAAGDGSSTSLGMRRFVKQAVAQFAGGTRLADLIELQVACCFTQLA